MEAKKFFIKEYFGFDTQDQEYFAVIKFILPKDSNNQLDSMFRNKTVMFLNSCLTKYWGYDYCFENEWYKASESEIRDKDLKELKDKAEKKLNELKNKLIEIVENNRKKINELPEQKFIEVNI